MGALASTLGVRPSIFSDYAYGPDFNTFTPTPTFWSELSASGAQLMLSVGNVTPAEATAIGTTLVAHGFGNAILRIMWEMNGNWFPWGTQAMTASQYVATYRAAYSAFAAVPGANFQYVWSVNAGTAEPGRTEFDTYPGDAYVTNIGFDFYDYNSGTHTGVSDSAVPPVIAFAASQGKPVSIDEWGLNGFDDPAFIDYVASVVDNPANNVAFQVYFDADASIITQYPLSASEFTKDFAG